MKTSLVKVAVLMGAAALLIIGCSNSDSSDGQKAENDLPAIPAKDWVDMTGKAEVTIDARDNVFVPENIVVSPGTKVTFENTGRNPHNALPVNKGDFDEVPTTKLQPKDKVSVSMKVDGEIPYYCSLHGTPKAGMKGRIKVAAA